MDIRIKFMTTKNWLQNRQKLFITGTNCSFLVKNFCEKEIKEWIQEREQSDEINTQIYYDMLSLYKDTLFQFYHLKTMSFDNLEKYQKLILTPRMQEGKDRESEIGNLFKEKHKAEITPNGENIAVLKEFNIGATPDYFIEKLAKFEGRGILECKLKSPTPDFLEERFIENLVYKYNLHNREDSLSAQKLYKDVIVRNYKFQVQLQLLSTGLDYGIICLAHKQHDLIGSKIENIETIVVRADKKLHEIIIKCSERIKEWLENIKNSNEIAMPSYDLDNPKDCLICDLLNLDEGASLKGKIYRFNLLKSFASEFKKINDYLYDLFEVKSEKANYKYDFTICGINYNLEFEPSEEREMTLEEIKFQLEKTQLEFQKANTLELGIAKKTGNRKLTIKKAFNGG
jgi:hypothetical protein